LVRFIYEGGIRVPAIFQWKDTIPAGRKISMFGMSTDLYPTFLDAAGISLPQSIKLDGMSILPELTGSSSKKHKKILTERISLWHNDFEGPRKTGWNMYLIKN
jgi:uncharacterized sulfatase